VNQEAPRERMLAGLPVVERRVRIGGVETAVLEGGDGPPLLLLHGGIECGAPYWAPVIPSLVRTHRVVAPDVPGLGESEAVDDLDPPTFDRWLGELLDESSGRPVVVAHSLVGNYAARFAIRHAERLDALVVYAAPGIGPYRIPFGLRAVAIRYAVRPTVRSAERFESYALLDREATRDRDVEWFDAFSTECLEKGKTRAVKRAMSRLLKFGAKRIPDSELARISSPVAVVWGRGDRMTPLSVAEVAVRELGWPMHIVDGAAHVPHLEQPERFLEALSDAVVR
jgi:pimeloyl-ACP methyl ester carboxylesterase